MKKFYLLSCLLGVFVSQAHAQSSVKIYGILDLSGAHINNGSANPSVNQLLSGAATSSRLGFITSEELGGGLSAFVQLETGIAADVGNAGTASGLSGTNAPTPTFFSRFSIVGLKGEFGTVTFGRNTTATIPDHFNANALISGYNTGIVTADYSQGINNDLWNNNEIKYESPVFSGFSFKTAYSLGEVTGSNKKNSNKGLILIYNQDNVKLTYSLQRDNDNTGKTLAWRYFTGSYNFGKVRIAGGFNRVDNSQQVVNASNFAWYDSKSATIGASYYITPELAVAGQLVRVKYSTSNTSSRQAVLNVDYALSKRTSIYALASSVKSGAVPIVPLFTSASAVPNSSASGIAFGVLHKF